MKRIAGSLALIVLATVCALAAPTVTRDAARVSVDLGNGCRLGFAVEQSYLLGLQTATLDGTALKGDTTVVRPYLIEEWVGQPQAWPYLRLRPDGVAITGETVTLTCDLVAVDWALAADRFFAVKDGRLQTGSFGFAARKPAAQVSSLEMLRAQVPAVETPASGGTLTWVIEPVTTNVAGWPYRGWKHHYSFTLPQGRQVNCLREVGSWELGGTAAGNTLVNMRDWGKGGIVSALVATDGAPDGPVAASYAAGEGVRGGGVSYFDFQYRPTSAEASWYERMTAVRSATNVEQGGRTIDRYDGLYFPLSGQYTTVPKVHVALVLPQALPAHEWHTRWQEMDQYVRDQVCAELGFVQSDPLPSLGINIDTGWAWTLGGMKRTVAAYQQAGVRRLLVHHAGWLNGRGLRQKETSFPIPLTADGKPDTGGDCAIHDYVPESDAVRDLWKGVTKACNAAGIEYWTWVTGMVHVNGPAVKTLGVERFTRNKPGEPFSAGYPPQLFGISIREPQVKAWWEGRMATAVDELGVQGFWADSFPNMFMSQMNYQMPDKAPQVREWWDWIAGVSRKGVGWMSEMTCFPGISCTITTGDAPKDFEGQWWVLPYSTRWYRGEDVPGAGTARADRLYFRSMANKGPIAPGSYGGDSKPLQQIPSFKRMSDEYMAALPMMRRPFQLPDDRGVLWLTNESDCDGVLFAFTDGDIPADVNANNIIDKAKVTAFQAHQTYLLRGKDLLASFGLQRGPATDPRIGQPYTPPTRYQKTW